MSHLPDLFASAVILAVTGAPVWADIPINTLASLNGGGRAPEGGVTVSADGSTLYGAASLGGASNYGAIFSVPINGGTPTYITTFSDPSGTDAEPSAGLIRIGSTLYGTMRFNGSSAFGSVFSVPVAGGTPTILGTFDGTNGSQPVANLTLVGTTFYGTTSGGLANAGTVFSIPVAGGGPTLLASFTQQINGRDLAAGLALSADGSTLYGTAHNGGPNGGGTVFSVPITGGTATVLGAFNITDGSNPSGDLTLSPDGKTLYGTTADGGANNDGTVFSIPTTGGTPTVLASFNVTDGYNPAGGLILSGGMLYGTTDGGGAHSDGVVFSVPAMGGVPAVLASFNGTDGAGPTGDLTLLGNTLYGTTSTGGTLNDGTVFSIVLSVPEPATVSLMIFAALPLLRRRRVSASRPM